MVVCTIGFSKKTLREFISRLLDAGVKKGNRYSPK
jgi:hypothetical protein